MRNIEEDRDIEEAIKFLVFTFQETGENLKPVILHSIRVGVNLYNRGYGKNIIIAAILHDLLEDTSIDKDEIKSKFGKKVLDIVEANTFSKNLEDKTERYIDTFERCFKVGREAVIVKAADILDNSHYYPLADSKGLRKDLIGKMKYFIEKSEPYIGNESLYQKLKDNFFNIKQRMNKRND